MEPFWLLAHTARFNAERHLRNRAFLGEGAVSAKKETDGTAKATRSARLRGPEDAKRSNCLGRFTARLIFQTRCFVQVVAVLPAMVIALKGIVKINCGGGGVGGAAAGLRWLVR